MDAETQITQLEQTLADARAVPLSSSVMVPRRELEDALAALRAALPEELRQARWVIKERDDLLQQGAREAEQLRADGLAEQQRLVDESEVLRVAQREAERIVEEARTAARTLRLESEDYVDAKLASFEAVLQRTLASVSKGRERLRGRVETEPAAAGGAGDSRAAAVLDSGPRADGLLPDGSREPDAHVFDHERGA